MNLFCSLAIAFSMYSRIPMPTVAWTKERMKYAMCFFPLIGVVIGAITYGSVLVLTALKLDWMARIFPVLVPLMVTGGIHMDGFLDVTDARASHAPAEKKTGDFKRPSYRGVCHHRLRGLSASLHGVFRGNEAGDPGGLRRELCDHEGAFRTCRGDLSHGKEQRPCRLIFRTGAEEDGCGHHVAVSRFHRVLDTVYRWNSSCRHDSRSSRAYVSVLLPDVKKRIWRNYRRSCRIFSSGVRAGADSSLCGRFQRDTGISGT